MEDGTENGLYISSVCFVVRDLVTANRLRKDWNTLIPLKEPRLWSWKMLPSEGGALPWGWASVYPDQGDIEDEPTRLPFGFILFYEWELDA